MQGGKSGGSVSAPIAARILEQIFEMEKGQEVKLEFLTPAVGHFNQVAGVDFGKDQPTQFGAENTPPTDIPSESNQPGGESGNGTSAAKPDISEDADSRANNHQKQQPNGLQKFFNFLGGGRSAAPKQSQ